MKNRILEDLKLAMKAQDKEKLSVVRMVKGAIQMEELNKKHELNDDEVIAIISKQIKSRKEAIVEFEKANRNDLVEQNQKEIEILNTYMPEQLSDDEINKIIDEAFTKINPTSERDMGKIIGSISPLLKGKADMGSVSKIVKERLSSL
ncbi:MAG: GatB/YqeY domain-containing protein [Bacilli bacterium]|nr:GatB/YqeY domain-containing protein [Bacilli bacterium]